MITTPLTTNIVEGISELEPTARGVRPHRLPSWVRQQFPENQLLSMEVQPAGARLRLRTTATRIELVTHPAYVAYQGIERPRGILDLYVNGELLQRDQLTGGDSIVVDLQTGQMTAETGPSHVLTISDLEPQRKTVEIWLPHNEGIELIELRSDQPLAAEATERPRWIHHGSSISQGSNAAAPSETWPTIVARHAGVDSLTGLPNRRLFNDRLTQATRRQNRRGNYKVAVLFLDLNGFKAINDRYGHKFGDAVLGKVGARIREELRVEDTVARWAGDEFTVIIDEADPAGVEQLIRRLRQGIARPFRIGEVKLRVEASIGVAFYPDEATTPSALLELADRRMFADKPGAPVA